MTYQHVPLDAPSAQIRLVRLRKGYFTNPVECDVFEAPLEPDGVPYEALSYAPTAEKDPVELSINGQRALIPWNLHLALHCLRLADSDRLLWIEGLCVDEADAGERGRQARLRGRVLQCAEQVLFWAGRATDDTDLVMDLAGKVEQYAKARRRSSQGQSLETATEAAWEQVLDELGGTKTAFYQRRVTGLAHLLDRPWARCVWALHSAAKAKRATLVCGWKSASSRALTLLLSKMGVHVAGSARHVLELMPGSRLEPSWPTGGRDLKTLMENLAHLYTGQGRDKIFALCGVSSDASDSTLLQPDYEMDEGELSARTLAFLVFGEGDSAEVMSCLPSWSFVQLLRAVELPGSMATILLKSSLEASNATLADAILSYKGFDVNQGESLTDVPLLILARLDDSVHSLRTLLRREDLDINIERSDTTALEIAITNNCAAVVEALLTNKDIDIERVASEELSPLALAAKTGNVKIAELLVQRGANLKWEDDKQRTPLRIAAENDNAEVASLLVSHGADMEATDFQWGSTPLSAAADRGFTSVVAVLLSKGADIDARRPPFYTTPLACAVDNKHWETARLLLDHDSDPLYVYENGESISTRAARLQGFDFLVYLAGRGVSIDAQDKTGRTPLHTAARNKDTKGALFIIEQGAQIDLRNHNGETPLFEAACYAKRPLLELLLSRGADINAQDRNGHSPLFGAVDMLKVDNVSTLLENGASVDVRGRRGESIVIKAGYWFDGPYPSGTRRSILTRLLGHGADIDAQDGTGKTALMYAAKNESFLTVGFLLQRGADRSLVDVDGRTALSYAACPEVKELLEKPEGMVEDPEEMEVDQLMDVVQLG